MGMLEVTGIASIVPFMAVIGDPAEARDNAVARWLSEALGLETSAQLVMALAVGLFLILAIRNVFNAVTTWLLFRWTALRNHSLSERLLRVYAYQPFEFFLNKNTSDLGAGVLSEVATFVNGVLFPLVHGAAHALVSLMIIALLLVVNPVLAVLISMIFALAYGAIYLITRKRLSILGQERSVSNADRYRMAAELLGGIKEIKVVGREEFFVRRFGIPSSIVATRSAASQIIAEIPRYALETLAFGGILLIVLLNSASPTTLDSALPLISLYAFAAYRLIPSLQNVFASFSKIRFSRPTLDLLETDLASENHQTETIDRPTALGSPKRSIDLHRVTFVYPGANEPALRDVSVSIPVGTVMGLAGPTGSGKSTLSDILIGVFRPRTGELRIDSQSIGDDRVRAWQSCIGYVPQRIYLYDDTITRNIAIGLSNAAVDRERVREVARIAQVDMFIEKQLPQSYETVIGEGGIRLSGGQRQRIGLARALYRDPAVLVLDEATSALDAVTEAAVLDGVRAVRPPRTIVMVAHRLTSIRSADQILVMKDGRIEDSGTFDSLIQSSRLFKDMASERA